MVVSADWQAEYSGLLLGDGSAYELREISGLADHPDLRTSDRTRLRRHGLLPGDDFLGGRAVTLELEVFGDTDAAFQAASDALALALQPGNPEAPLKFKVPGVAGGGVRRLNARPRKLALPIEQRFFYRQPIATVLFEASDPRLYDDAQSQLSTGLASSPSGLVWNLVWNLSWGASSSSGSIFAVNAGTFPTPPTFRIDGPVTNPSIENITTGEVLGLTNLTVGSGEFLELDADARTVLLGGTASRYEKLTTAQWFDLKPGTTELKFRGTTAGAPTLQVTWRSAWLK